VPSRNTPTPSDDVPADAPSTGKGRPTPKRREAEALRKRPLVPNDRRAAAKAGRQQLREARARQHQALITNDEKNYPARDRGPIRRYVRNVVDSRWNLGELFLPFSIVMVFAILLTGSSVTAALITITVLYGAVLATIVDAFILSRRLRRGINEKFGEDAARGNIMYGVVRAFQMRRSRLPRPQVKRGERPA
jgi:hypothetical protein